MKCWKCGNELTTGYAPNSSLCRSCEEKTRIASVQSPSLFCRCGAPLIETSNGHYVCKFIQGVERKQQEQQIGVTP